MAYPFPYPMTHPMTYVISYFTSCLKTYFNPEIARLGARKEPISANLNFVIWAIFVGIGCSQKLDSPAAIFSF